MGVGKGTVARALARESELFAIDTDDLIESLENRKIKEIFKTEGEPYFRKLEQKTADWLATSVQNAIISTGGGFYKVKNVKAIGTVILLDASFDAIYKRILSHPNAEKKLAKRPLFQSPQKAKKLYKEREAAYREIADHIIQVEGKSPEKIAKEIKKLLS